MTPLDEAERHTYADYLLAEERDDRRLEFYDGLVVAMAVGTPEHAALTAALIAELTVALRGKPCRVYSSDLRVLIEATNASVHPDVSVVCGELARATGDPLAVTNPVLLVEVLSPSTEGHDRGPKPGHYRRIESLREYVLVSQHEPHVEVYRRNEHGRWELFESRAGETIQLASVDVELSIDTLFADPLCASAS